MADRLPSRTEMLVNHALGGMFILAGGRAAYELISGGHDLLGSLGAAPQQRMVEFAALALIGFLLGGLWGVVFGKSAKNRD